MIGKLARKFGFQQSVPVALVDDWILPSTTLVPVELAPRGGAGSCSVDQFGRIQVRGATWTIDLTLAAGARWVAASRTERVTQKLLAPGVLETTIQTPSGPVLQRVAAGVIDAEPVAIVEIENTGGVAIAAGVVVRPIRLEGRGYIGEATVDSQGIVIDGASAVGFTSAPALVVAAAGATGDLLANLADANTQNTAASANCRSGGAQAAAVWPLPHTATTRFIVQLGAPISASTSVPATADVNRGWQSHLKQGLRVDIDGLEIGDHVGAATRSVLTLWPKVPDTPLAILAMSEIGFGRDAGRFFELLERCEDDGQVLRSLARWAQLGHLTQQLEDLEHILGRLAQAAHGVGNRGGSLEGRAWLGDALVTLGGRLHQIDQPDVAERVQGFTVRPVGTDNRDRAVMSLAALTKTRDERGVWSDGDQMERASNYVRTLRSLVANDTGVGVGLLPIVPRRWQGRTVDVFGLPVANGTMSFGLRWHGPRPALFWETNLVPDAPFHITAPGIDPGFGSDERNGEVLLADPGWQKS